MAVQRSIVLVGLMGAGKTSVGKRLAAHLGVPFVDSDDAVRAASGMDIPEMFAHLGEPAFRDGERRVIARLLSGAPQVVATGGGAFMDAGTRAAVRAAGVSVFLDAELETLWARVRDKPGRPLLATEDPKGTLSALRAARLPTYREADVTVLSEAGQPHEAMVARIVEALRAHDAAHPARPVFEGEDPEVRHG